MLHSNFGGTDRVGTMWVAERAENVVFETSATAEPTFIQELVAAAGKDRVVYGSDWPALSPRLELAVVEAADLTQEERDAVSGGNLARLFGLSVEQNTSRTVMEK
jgi:predicted TIM-barrel fold metal-dependent hydrolase